MSKDLYENFHKNSSSQIKLIDESNFTYRIIFSLLNQYLGKRKLRILDYGCGVGSISLYLASLGHTVHGFDISKKAIKVALQSSKNLNIQKCTRFNVTNTERLRLKSNQYDLVICTEVIEHLHDDLSIIKDFYKLLKRNGLLFISTPSLNAPVYKIGLAGGFDTRVGHLRRYAPESVKNLVEKAKFKIEKLILKEGIVRNAMYVMPSLGFMVRFMRGPIADIITLVDDLSVKLFGESDIFVIARKP